MSDFAGKIAVITGGGTGMGRALAEQLVAAGAHVAFCDIFEDNLAAARAACSALAAPGVRVSAHLCDVSDEAQMERFRDQVMREHATAHIDLLFNNAGIGGGSSFLADERERWERAFDVSWRGTYLGARVFMPLLVKSQAGWIVNTSSVHGFLAMHPSGTPQSAYSTAKFAIKGFSEALIADLRTHAPHVRVALVMPGHVGTSIVRNTLREQNSALPDEMDDDELARARQRVMRAGGEALDDAQLRELIRRRIDVFIDTAPMTASQAATVILDGLRAGRWRILVGSDAHQLDVMAREHPEEIYEPSFAKHLVALFPGLAGSVQRSSGQSGDGAG